MGKDTFVAVNKGNAGFARRCRCVAGVEREVVRIAVKFADIQHIRTVCAMEDGELCAVACLVVGQCKGFSGLNIVGHCVFRSLN